MPAPLQLRETYEVSNTLGDTYLLNDGRTRTVLSSAGEGTPPVEYLTSSGPLEDGATLRGYRVRPRALIYLLRWQGCSRQQYQSMRAALENVVRPNQAAIGTLAPLTLTKRYSDLSGSVVRSIDVMIGDGPGFQPVAPTQWDGFGFSETVRFNAFNPIWYDPALATLAFTGTAADELVFPFSFPFIFGASYSATGTLTYGGTWREYPTIILAGPFERAIVTNTTTDETLDLNYHVGVGQSVTIDLSYGAKSITLSTGANLLPYLSADSDLATWHLEPAPAASGGVNQIDVFLANTEATAPTITIEYHNRYFGI